MKCSSRISSTLLCVTTAEGYLVIFNLVTIVVADRMYPGNRQRNLPIMYGALPLETTTFVQVRNWAQIFFEITLTLFFGHVEFSTM